MKQSKSIAILLLISAINLTVMVPGGPVESRDFSHISPNILGTFNVFLTCLGMVSLFLAYFVFRKQNWSIYLAFLCGISYFTVFVIDIAKIFPQSPSAMPPLLFLLETLGIILSIPIMFRTYSILKDKSLNEKTIHLSKAFYALVGLAILIGIGIIIFATNAALNSK